MEKDQGNTFTGVIIFSLIVIFLLALSGAFEKNRSKTEAEILSHELDLCNQVSVTPCKVTQPKNKDGFLKGTVKTVEWFFFDL